MPYLERVMELSQILNALSEDGQEKTASSNDQGGVSNNPTPLSAALDSALSAMGTEKTASAAQPEGDLTKIASRLASAEQEALVKEAELYGAALCDGFMSRMGQYEGTAGGGFGKTASDSTVTEEGFSKFASENPALVKQAMELGYRETKGQLEKVAEDAFYEGYEKTAEFIKQAAEDCAHAGFNHATHVLGTL